MTSEKEQFLTPTELSIRYKGKISVRTLANWRSSSEKNGPAYVKAGNKVLYPLSAILEWERTRFMKTSVIIAGMASLPRLFEWIEAIV